MEITFPHRPHLPLLHSLHHSNPNQYQKLSCSTLTVTTNRQVLCTSMPHNELAHLHMPLYNRRQSSIALISCYSALSIQYAHLFFCVFVPSLNLIAVHLNTSMVAAQGLDTCQVFGGAQSDRSSLERDQALPWRRHRQHHFRFDGCRWLRVGRRWCTDSMAWARRFHPRLWLFLKQVPSSCSSGSSSCCSAWPLCSSFVVWFDSCN